MSIKPFTMKAENKAYKIDLLMASLIFILTLFLLLTSSCKHEPQILPNQDPNSENNGTGNANGNGNGNGNQASTCSPDSVYFQKSILPLIVSNCAKSGCHDAASHKDGIVLDSYANIMNHGEIRPGRPGNSELIEVITETDPDDIMPPPPAAPMSQADINLLTAWINQGAQNNDCTDGNCDTTNISFSGTVSPILQSKCVGCHNNSLQSGQVNLSGHANVLIYAQSGSLLGSIMHANGYFPMPKGGTQLSDCEISSVRTWIRNGALNN